jgi:hypothetical protein
MSRTSCCESANGNPVGSIGNWPASHDSNTMARLTWEPRSRWLSKFSSRPMTLVGPRDELW